MVDVEEVEKVREECRAGGRGLLMVVPYRRSGCDVMCGGVWRGRTNLAGDAEGENAHHVVWCRWEYRLFGNLSSLASLCARVYLFVFLHTNCRRWIMKVG